MLLYRRPPLPTLAIGRSPAHKSSCLTNHILCQAMLTSWLCRLDLRAQAWVWILLSLVRSLVTWGLGWCFQNPLLTSPLYIHLSWLPACAHEIPSVENTLPCLCPDDPRTPTHTHTRMDTHTHTHTNSSECIIWGCRCRDSVRGLAGETYLHLLYLFSPFEVQCNDPFETQTHRIFFSKLYLISKLFQGCT